MTDTIQVLARRVLNHLHNECWNPNHCDKGRDNFALAEALNQPDPLTFERVRSANKSRSERWHSEGVGPWSGGDWSNAMMGEVGELAEAVLAMTMLTAAAGNAANTVKKLRRQETGVTGSLDPEYAVLLEKLGAEMADVFLYLDLLGQLYGVDLAAAVVAKFDAVSEREGMPERLGVQA